MQSEVKLVRAISSEFAVRKLKSVALVMGILALVAVAAAIWLTTISAWWWLAAAPVIICALCGIMTFLAARMIIKKLRPDLTKTQASAVTGFVDKLERVADNLQTPMFIIVFRMVRDVVRPQDKAFIRTVAEDSTTLHKDLMELQKNFS